MSLTSGPVNEFEQAAEKAADHIGTQSEPMVVRIIQALFDRVWQTRICIDIGQREVTK